MSVEVTNAMIAAVVEHTRCRLNMLPDWEPGHLTVAVLTGDIAALLNHLQANPRVPSDEEMWELRKAVSLAPTSLDGDHYLRQWTIESRRRQFAPKTPAVPDAIKDLQPALEEAARLLGNPIFSYREWCKQRDEWMERYAPKAKA